MWKRELLKNKLIALLLVGLGVLTLFIGNDATAFIFLSLIGVPLFFAKENWIMDKEGNCYARKEVKRKRIRHVSDSSRKESHGYRNTEVTCGVRRQTR